MHKLFLCVQVLALCALPLMAGEASDDGVYPASADESSAPYEGPVWDGPQAVLWDNGPVITSYGTGVGGADESILDPLENTNGFGCQWGADIRLADDFEIPAGTTWEIDMITVIGYQTNEGPPSSITGVYIEIYDDEPEFGNLLYGDLFTNVMTTTEFMNCYRVNEAGSGTTTNRPLMVQTSEFGTAIVLSEGTYWMCWQQDGFGESGPWNPPITINGQLETGNAVQYYTGAWSPIADSMSGELKGLPFTLQGTITSLENETWGAIKAVF